MWLARVIMLVFCLVLLFTGMLYLRAEIYDFPAGKPFEGSHIYNPYEGLKDSVWLRANFHAHTIAWGGLTNGHDTEQQIYDGYTQKGYDLACISNYHSISTYGSGRSPFFIPVYEHGFNIFKSHCLAIGAEGVSFEDFPLLQATSHQQSVITAIRDKGAMVCIAHPDFGGGRSFEDMRQLTGYRFTEVLNHYRLSDEYWDEGMSAGRLSWILGNDDTHDMRDNFTFHRFTMVAGPCTDAAQVRQQLQKGRHYAIRTQDGVPDIGLISCVSTGGGEYRFNFSRPADSIIIVGQSGKTLMTVKGSHTAIYKFRPEDSYIRAVAVTGNSQLYLNPLVRCTDIDDPFVSAPAAKENIPYTWTYRLFILALMTLPILGIKKIVVREPARV